VRDILGNAGFRDVGIDLWRGDQYVGGPGADPATAAAFILESLGMAEALRDRPEEARHQALADLEMAYRPYHGPDGVRVPAAAWLVRARA
jgi:hypothetical protein